MGCDIHTYIEFAEPPAEGRQPYWRNFTCNGGSRNYVMFGVLAGVRMQDVQLFAPKGMPEGILGFYTDDDYWTNVAPADHPEWSDLDGFVSLEQAEEWVTQGYSVAEYDKDGRLTRVSGPDWHSHSWLAVDELAQALDRYASKVGEYWPNENGVPAEWAAMLAAMRSLEASGQLVRIVFWFDN